MNTKDILLMDQRALPWLITHFSGDAVVLVLDGIHEMRNIKFPMLTTHFEKTFPLDLVERIRRDQDRRATPLESCQQLKVSSGAILLCQVAEDV